MNLVKSGILNNVESYLTSLSNVTDFTEAKKIVLEMIQSFGVSDNKKQKLIVGLNRKRTTQDILFFAYNMNLSAEGLKV